MLLKDGRTAANRLAELPHFQHGAERGHACRKNDCTERHKRLSDLGWRIVSTTPQ
jgi:hypothetical protein